MQATLLALTVLGGLAAAAPLSSRPSAANKRSNLSTFYIVDNASGSLANAVSNPSGVFFGSDRNAPTLFIIDSSTNILMTANPGQTAYDSYINSGSYSPVQIGTSASSGFLKCSTTNDQLYCSADDGNTEFLLDGSSENSTDYQLYLAQPGATSTYARNATLSVQYTSPTTATTPTRFYLSTSMGYAVDFGANSGIYAGTDYAKESAGSVYTLNNSTGYLTTSSSSSGSSDVSYVAYIDTASTNAYSVVQLSAMPLSSSTMVPLACQIATDGSLNITCKADTYEQMWLDLGKSTSGDYTLYMGTAGSTGNGTQRLAANAVVSNCTSCS